MPKRYRHACNAVDIVSDLKVAPTGIGAEHAKWSPVATAWYRLNPEVVLLKVRQR